MKAEIKPWNIKTCLKEKIVCFIGYLPYRLYGLLVSRKKILKDAYSIQTQYNSQFTEFKYPQASLLCGQDAIPTNVFNSFTELVFENTKFSVPFDYRTFLKYNYGDYMKLPPEDQRENRHRVIEIKF